MPIPVTRSVVVTLTALPVLAVVSAAGARPSSHRFASFYTPAKAAYCNLITDISSDNYFTPFLNCWTPNDGFTVTLSAKGRPKHGYLSVNKSYHSNVVLRRLRFGQSWWANRRGVEGTGIGKGKALYRCVSRSTGLTCKSVGGHGFWLGRFRGYRIF